MLRYIEADVMWEHAPLEGLAAVVSWPPTVTRTSGSAWTRWRLRYPESLWDAGQAPGRRGRWTPGQPARGCGVLGYWSRAACSSAERGASFPPPVIGGPARND